MVVVAPVQGNGGVGDAIAQGLQGLTQGGMAGLNMGMALRKAQMLEDAQKLNERQQQFAEQKQAINTTFAWANLPSKARAATLNMFLPAMVPGADPNNLPPDQLKAFQELVKDDGLAESFANFAAQSGSVGPEGLKTFKDLINNGHLPEAVTLLSSALGAQTKAADAAATRAYQQQQLNLGQNELNEKIRHNQADEAANARKLDTPDYGSVIQDADGNPWAVDKRTGQLTRVPVAGGQQGAPAGGAPAQGSQPTGAQGLRPPTQVEQAEYDKRLAQGYTADVLTQHARDKGIDFGNASPGAPAPSPTAPQPSGGFRPPEKSLTEAQTKEAGWLGRAQLGDKSITDFASAEPDFFKSIPDKFKGGSIWDAIGNGLEGLSENTVDTFVANGGLRSLPVASAIPESWLVGDRMERYLAKFTPFVSAALRKDTGAAISSQEWGQAMREWIPLPGDSAEVMADKAKARQEVIEGMRIGAGPGAAKVGMSR